MTPPIRIATWMDADATPEVVRSFRFAREVELRNARRESVDLGAADALLLTGGSDIDAGSLNQPVPSPSPIRRPEPKRDRWEFAVLKQAIDRGIPILAICRGHQVLNVALGGTLLLDIPGHRLNRILGQRIQPLRYAAGTPSWRRFARVNSVHHQAIDRLADGLVAEAWCASDNIVEQVRLRAHPWCIGVQYHPERSPSYGPLFKAFVRKIRGD